MTDWRCETANLREELVRLVKPCKSCGARPRIGKVSVGDVVHGHYVRCSPCGLVSKNGKDYRDAVLHWNKSQIPYRR